MRWEVWEMDSWALDARAWCRKIENFFTCLHLFGLKLHPQWKLSTGRIFRLEPPSHLMGGAIRARKARHGWLERWTSMKVRCTRKVLRARCTSRRDSLIQRACTVTPTPIFSSLWKTIQHPWCRSDEAGYSVCCWRQLWEGELILYY